MASLLLLDDDMTEHQLRRERVFRDRANPLDYLCDAEIKERYRLPRPFILNLIDMLADDLQRTTKRSHPLPVYTQVINFISLLYFRVRSYIHLRCQHPLFLSLIHVKPIIHNHQLSQSIQYNVIESTVT
jgi:hypothetical protein